MTSEGTPRTRAPHRLTLRDVGFSYSPSTGEPVDVLVGQGLTVEPGRLTVVAGRSGSGKTTLLHIACGLLRPDRGEIQWGDIAMNCLSADELADWRRLNTGIVSQGGGLIGFLTAAENVGIAGFGRGRRHPEKRVTEALGQVGLENRNRHFPHELSAGERQRVALARALFNDPMLLVADEPTASLDRQNADVVIDLLIGLSRSHRSTLVASHDPKLIEAADDLLELD